MDELWWVKKFGNPEPYKVGTRVHVKRCAEDFHYFNGNDFGTVTKNSLEYLGIEVTFDKPRRYVGGRVMRSFNFHPINLEIISEGS